MRTVILLALVSLAVACADSMTSPRTPSARPALDCGGFVLPDGRCVDTGDGSHAAINPGWHRGHER